MAKIEGLARSIPCRKLGPLVGPASTAAWPLPPIWSSPRSVQSGRISADFFANLENRLGYGPEAEQGRIPTQVTHGSLHSWGLDRPAVKNEWFAIQGWPIYPDMEKICGLKVQFSSMIPKMKVTHVKRLMGNAIHLPLLFKQLVYILSRLRPSTRITEFEDDNGIS